MGIDSSPKLTICVPTRDRSDFLKQSIFPQVERCCWVNWAILDNASKDDTKFVVNDYIHRNGLSNLKAKSLASPLSKENSFRAILDLVDTKYFMYLFDDDIVSPSRLSSIIEVLENNNSIDVLAFNRELCYFSSTFPDPQRAGRLFTPNETGRLYTFPTKYHRTLLGLVGDLLPSTPNVTSAIFRTEFMAPLIQENDDFFSLGHMGDYNISNAIMYNCSKFSYLDTALVLYGQWESNTTSQLRDLSLTSTEYVQWVREGLELLRKELNAPMFSWPSMILLTNRIDAKRYGKKPFVSTLSAYVRSYRDFVRIRRINRFRFYRMNIQNNLPDSPYPFGEPLSLLYRLMLYLVAGPLIILGNLLFVDPVIRSNPAQTCIRNLKVSVRGNTLSELVELGHQFK